MNAVLILLTLLLPSQAKSSVDAAKLKTAHDQAQLCADATVKADYEKLADYTHPSAIEAMGGREEMIKKIREATSEMKKEGVSFVSSSVSAPESIHAVDSELFVVVPMTLVIKLKDAKYKSKGYLVGCSSNDGKTWKFLDGAAGELELRKLVPKLPKAMHFPNKEKPQKIADK